ncbi:hypothetical protein Phpb_01598 [Photorhabdus namnaonensis]|uniref:Uncharacterized protein n=1 Tax=Photorhabdus namnaonensis TaxID=1851568 RepID=A0A1B8YJL0_9GAMM|nr:hypothetical protein Phpb_01598 [Photorhabdus namnaonensis]
MRSIQIQLIAFLDYITQFTLSLINTLPLISLTGFKCVVFNLPPKPRLFKKLSHITNCTLIRLIRLFILPNNRSNRSFTADSAISYLREPLRRKNLDSSNIEANFYWNKIPTKNQHLVKKLNPSFLAGVIVITSFQDNYNGLGSCSLRGFSANHIDLSSRSFLYPHIYSRKNCLDPLS